ncbi:hypothetical protein ACJRO7_028707 [Eucalyptus globulus]|uniref:RING-type domain-containing protein n=1 Tax=Eucalyptus globulus TaxID=34317 RepID=A0ABD3K2C0_EUCGL
MSSSSSSSGGGSLDGISPYVYMFILGVVVLIVVITLSCYHCIRASRAVGRGIVEATLQTYPTVLFSSVKHHEEIGGGSCSICLGEYEESDVLRPLPECRHFFHMECIDPWLRLHATCPICRKSPEEQLGHPGLEPETVAVPVDGDLHSGDR